MEELSNREKFRLLETYFEELKDSPPGIYRKYLEAEDYHMTIMIPEGMNVPAS